MQNPAVATTSGWASSKPSMALHLKACHGLATTNPALASKGPHSADSSYKSAESNIDSSDQQGDSPTTRPARACPPLTSPSASQSKYKHSSKSGRTNRSPALLHQPTDREEVKTSSPEVADEPAPAEEANSGTKLQVPCNKGASSRTETNKEKVTESSDVRPSAKKPKERAQYGSSSAAAYHKSKSGIAIRL
jgi:hypothetical protein